MGKSDISGWGVFAKDDIQKGELVVEMRGAIISHDESERRGFIYDLFKHTFLFDLDDRKIRKCDIDKHCIFFNQLNCK